MRASDIGIVSPVDAQVVTSGAAPVTINRINDAGITFFGEGAAGFSRASDRSAPYNLMADLAARCSTPEGRRGDAPRRLPAVGRRRATCPKGKKATTIAAGLRRPHHQLDVLRRQATSTRTPTPPTGDEFPADTVLVLRVQVGDAGYLDPAGNPVPETKLDGKGKALIFHDGKRGDGHLEQGRPRRRHQLSTKAGTLRSRPVTSGSSWCPPRAATSPVRRLQSQMRVASVGQCRRSDVARGSSTPLLGEGLDAGQDEA